MKEEAKEMELWGNQLIATEFLSYYDRLLLSLIKREYLDSFTKPLSFRFPDGWMGIDDKSKVAGFALKAFRYYDDFRTDLVSANLEKFLSGFKENRSHNLIFSLSGKSNKAPEFNLYAIKRERGGSIDSFRDFLMDSYKSNFQGAELEPLSAVYYSKDVLSFVNTAKYSGVMLGIPACKKNERGIFLQGVERLADALNGLEFRIQIIASPIPLSELRENQNNILNLKNELGVFLKEIKSENFSKTLTETLTKSANLNLGRSLSEAVTKIGEGAWLQSVLPFVTGTIGSVFPVIGTLIDSALGAALATGTTYFAKLPLFNTNTITDSFGGSVGLAKSDSQSLSRSVGIMRERINYAVEHALKILDEHINRLQEAESYGYWNVGAYIFAKERITYNFVKNALVGQFNGDVSHLEPIRSIDLFDTSCTDTEIDKFKAFVGSGLNPNTKIFEKLSESGASLPKHHPMGKYYDGISTPLSTPELSIYFAPPQRENLSIKVTKYGTFSGSILAETDESNSIAIGDFLYCGNKKNHSKIRVPVSELTRHMFVSGITGSGKTNTVHHICDQILKKGIKFLIIEPTAKTEYRDLRNVDIYSLGTDGENLSLTDVCGAPFRINPFYFPKGVSVLGHIDRLKYAFNSAFPMYSAMPYILETAINRIYEKLGWDLSSNSNIYCDDPWSDESCNFFPILEDLYNIIDHVVKEVGYDQRLESDMSGALKARLRSLLIGNKGEMLNTKIGLKTEDLIKNNVVLEMKHMGNDEEKVFLMGIILNNIYEYASITVLSGGKLKKVIVIEEAHRLFRNADNADNLEIANVRGAAIEQFSNMLAEMRAMGYGFIIVDQIPSKILPDVIKNTAIKKTHQIARKDDRDTIGDAMTLGDSEKNDLPKLKCGEASIYINGWNRAALCNISKFDGEISDIYEINKNIKESSERIRNKDLRLFARRIKKVNPAYVKSVAFSMLSKNPDVICKTLDFIKTQDDVKDAQLFDAIVYRASEELLREAEYPLFVVRRDILKNAYDVKDWTNIKSRLKKEIFKNDEINITEKQRIYIKNLLEKNNLFELPLKIGKFHEGKKAYKVLNEEIKKFVLSLSRFIDDRDTIESIEMEIAEILIRRCFINSELILKNYVDYSEGRFL